MDAVEPDGTPDAVEVARARTLADLSALLAAAVGMPWASLAVAAMVEDSWFSATPAVKFGILPAALVTSAAAGGLWLALRRRSLLAPAGLLVCAAGALGIAGGWVAHAVSEAWLEFTSASQLLLHVVFTMLPLVVAALSAFTYVRHGRALRAGHAELDRPGLPV